MLALVAPAVLGPLNKVWMQFSLLLSKIVQPIVLGVLFFVVLMPIGLLMRAGGKDLLNLKWSKTESSYWILRKPPGPAPETMKNQF